MGKEDGKDREGSRERWIARAAKDEVLAEGVPLLDLRTLLWLSFATPKDLTVPLPLRTSGLSKTQKVLCMILSKCTPCPRPLHGSTSTLLLSPLHPVASDPWIPSSALLSSAACALSPALHLLPLCLLHSTPPPLSTPHLSVLAYSSHPGWPSLPSS